LVKIIAAAGIFREFCDDFQNADLSSHKTKGGQYVTYQMEPGDNFLSLNFEMDGRFF